MSRDSFLDIPSYPGKQKPRSHRCFKPGDLILFVDEGEVGILIKRFDLYAKEGVISKNPSWSWNLHISPGKTLPKLCNYDYGISEINLYNCMGFNIKWVPTK